ncbi:MAG: ribonuclease D [Magnetococcales bacterium]|nr:ribonuclease D [Magnetococcales bacterium]
MNLPVHPPVILLDDLDEERLQIYLNSPQLAVDTETRGLCVRRDRLCLVQMCNAEGVVTLVKIREERETPRLKQLLEFHQVEKVFHFARYDMATLLYWLGIQVYPVYCTKIASRIGRTYTDRHGLKDLTREFFGVDMNKDQQSSDWASETLSPEQQQYAANDVTLLLAVRDKLEAILRREQRDSLARACMDFLSVRVALDLAGWEGEDIFAH